MYCVRLRTYGGNRNGLNPFKKYRRDSLVARFKATGQANLSWQLVTAALSGVWPRLRSSYNLWIGRRDAAVLHRAKQSRPPLFVAR